MSATIPGFMKQSVVSRLGLRNPVVVVGTILRDNLIPEVQAMTTMEVDFVMFCKMRTSPFTMSCLG
jgi:hypothetical protein